MEVYLGSPNLGTISKEEMEVIRKGPWTAEEDSLLFDYVNVHGEGHWNLAARYAGLKRTGKSCRLRWLNYLRPNVRRGNITLQEQLLILQLHSQWGNRWSKIAQYLPGRTDNEIKNYWRTRVQKQAKQLNCDVNSQQFRDTMRYVWIPQLMEKIRASSSEASMGGGEYLTSTTTPDLNPTNDVFCNNNIQPQSAKFMPDISSGCSLLSSNTQNSDPVDCQSLSEQSSMQDGSCLDNTWSSCWDDMHRFESDMHAFGFEQTGIWSESNCGDSFMEYCLWNGDDGNNQDTLLLQQQHLYCD